MKGKKKFIQKREDQVSRISQTHRKGRNQCMVLYTQLLISLLTTVILSSYHQPMLVANNKNQNLSFSL